MVQGTTCGADHLRRDSTSSAMQTLDDDIAEVDLRSSAMQTLDDDIVEVDLRRDELWAVALGLIQ